MKRTKLNKQKSLSREQLRNITGSDLGIQPVACHRICCPKSPMPIPPCKDLYCLDVICDDPYVTS